MRVISGTRKGYKIKAPKGQDTRPTKDRVKESLFNILGEISDESIILDLYSGSGSIGIEFLSRGAKEAYFVDRSYLSIKTIKENLIHTKLLSNSTIIKNDVLKSIELLQKGNIKFDYIFIDPPFGKKMISNTLLKLAESDVLNNKAMVIIEHEKEVDLEEKIFNLQKIDNRNYGQECLTFYIQNNK